MKARHLLVANHGSNGQRVLVKIRPPQLPSHRHRREASCSTDGRQSSDEDDDDEEEEGDSNSSAASGETDTSPAAGSIDGVPQSGEGDGGNLKMRIVAPDRRRVISRPCAPQGSVPTRPARGKADLFPHLPRLTPKSAKYGGKLSHQRQQLAPEDDDEAAAMSDSEDSMTQQIKMKVVRRAADRAGVCAHPGDEDDDDDDDEDGDEEEEETSEYASSPDSAAPQAADVDQSATPKSSRRRHGENLNSDDDGTPKRKRSKSDADGGKMQGRNGADPPQDIGSKEVSAVNKLLGMEIEPGQSTAVEQEQASAAASLHDNMAASQVIDACIVFCDDIMA